MNLLCKFVVAATVNGAVIFGAHNSYALEHVQCDNVFEHIDLVREAAGTVDDDNHDKKYFQEIIDSTIAATESYLDNCTEAGVSLAKQPAALQRLDTIARHDCSSKAAATQLIEIDHDGMDELLLHVKVLDGMDLSGCPAGVSILFSWNAERKRWAGSPIWPTELLDKAPVELPGDVFLSSVFHPKMYMLGFRDKQDRPYMAIETTSQGGDNVQELLTVIRLERQASKAILSLNLNDWCGQSTTWIIKHDGTIIVPEARATERCEMREKVVYHLDDF